MARRKDVRFVLEKSLGNRIILFGDDRGTPFI